MREHWINYALARGKDELNIIQISFGNPFRDRCLQFESGHWPFYFDQLLTASSIENAKINSPFPQNDKVWLESAPVRDLGIKMKGFVVTPNLAASLPAMRINL